MTISAIPGLVLAAGNRGVLVKLHIVGYQQIKLSVAVIVEPCRRGRPCAIVSYPGFRRHIRERPISIVVVPQQSRIPDDVEVRESVIVKISHCGAKKKC